MTQSSTTTERGVQAAPVEESAFPWPLVLDFSAVEMTDDQFVKFCSDNGVRLGWLIDPFERAVHIYQAGQAVQVLQNPEAVSGEPALPGFMLYLSEIW